MNIRHILSFFFLMVALGLCLTITYDPESFGDFLKMASVVGLVISAVILLDTPYPKKKPKLIKMKSKATSRLHKSRNNIILSIDEKVTM